MNTKVVAFFGLGIGALLVLWLARPGPRLPPSVLPVPSPTTPPATDSAAEAFGLIQASAESLRGGARRTGGSGAVLAELRAWLAGRSKDEAVAALRTALRAGIDADTGQDLKPGPGGTLTTVSSLRGFLLDELRRRDPEGAQALAREILQSSTRPDEWALCLAICATDTSEAGRQFVREKSRQLAMNASWQQMPSAGFLEAFDLFVYTRDTEFVPQLSGFLAQTNNRALAHAAFLTLDRMVLADAAGTLGELSRNPALLAGREATRAGYFARADARDPAQRALLENYVLDPARSPDELNRWAGSFPNANFMISDNLITPSGAPGTDLAGRDQAALGMIQAWLNDPRFGAMKPTLENIRGRLQKFVPSTR